VYDGGDVGDGAISANLTRRQNVRGALELHDYHRSMLRSEDHDDVRVLTLERPERRNAFDQAQYVALAQALADAAADDTVRCVVITGAGGCFSAGQDLDEMAAIARGELPGADGFTRLLEQLETFPKPLIAAVIGAAVGIGATMLLHCDIVLVADNARLKFPFATMGVPPEAAASALLADTIGWQHASELLFTARWLDAHEAAAIGLALTVVPVDDALDRALDLAASIAANQPRAVQTAKRLLLASRGDRSTNARARENREFAALFAEGRS
jgi:enoyl-CoA hydratase/carnithine racemase